MDNYEEELSQELREKRICRFCLTQAEPLSDIFNNDEPAECGTISKKTPLTLQIMACVAVEVYKDDGMPATICDNCRALMDHSYRFKQICKKADTLLKTYPITGVWPERIPVPVNLFKSAANVSSKAPVKKELRNTLVQRKAPVVSQTVTVIPGIERTPQAQYDQVPEVDEPDPDEQAEDPLDDVKPKIVKLSMEDLRNIRQGKPINKTQLVKKSPAGKDNQVKVLRSEVIVPSSEPAPPTKYQSKCPVKLINGSLPGPKPVLLNSFKSPKVIEHFIQTSEGTLEIITTETQETDPMKSATPVETNVFPCTECERSFPLRQLLEIHMQNHNRERNFPCEMCDKRFFSKYDLAKHNLTHTGERPYVCIICKAAFSRSTLLTRHQKVHRDQPKFLCMFCERTFLSNEELQKHSETHQKVRPFQCSKCSKSFAYKQGLERHEVTHETNLPFPCEHCDLSFASAGKLARHLTAHAGSRPYPCRWCNRAFMLSHHLTRHLRSHNQGNGSYKCTECVEIFSSQDELIYHSAIHATESKTCPLCREHFDSLEQVTEHIKQHSEGVQYACDYCDLLFTSEERLEDHCQMEHLSVLATETEPEQKGVAQSDGSANETVVDKAQQFIIEEIAINNDGSKMITTFVDGEQKEKKLIRKGQTIKSEEDAITFTEEELEAADGSDEDEDGFVDDDDWQDDEEEAQEPTPSRKLPVAPPMAKPQSAFRPGVGKLEVAKPSTSKAAPKATQQKLDSYLKKTPSVAPPKTVSDVLQKLPKSMVVKRPLAIVKPESTSQAVQQKKTSLPMKVPPSTQPPKRPAEPEKQAKSVPRVASKRPLEDSQSHLLTKKVAVEPKAAVATKAGSTPVAIPRDRPISTSTPIGELKKGKTFEMKIGNKMVKVQKVVMTKAEVAKMARDGKIEMQGGTMILKQQKGGKQ